MLWRACSKIKANLISDKATQNIELHHMTSIPGDFSASKKVAYWTTQNETAERYAKWLKLKLPVAEICIIQAAVPEAFTLSFHYVSDIFLDW